MRPATAAGVNPLGTVKVTKLLPGFAIPCIIAMLVNALYNIVDQIFIGHGVGYLGNAATNVAFPLSTIAMSVALMMAQGGASKQNLELGAGNKERAEKAVGNMVFMLLLFGLLLFLLSFLFLTPLLYFFGATVEVMPYALSYTGIIIWGLPFVIMSTGLNNTIRADGSPKYSMFCMLIGAVINTVLDPLFIFTFDMGVAGAAYATVIGQVVSCILSLLYLPRYRYITLTKPCFKPEVRLCLKLCALGVASFCNQFAMTIVQIVLNNTMTYYGALSTYGSDIPLACTGIMMKVNMIFMAIVIGIAQGSQPIFSYNYGARRYDRVRETYKAAAVGASTVAVAAFLLLQIFPRQIMNAFGDGSPEYFQFAERLFRVYLFFTFLNGIQPLTTVFFTSIGKALKGTFIALTRQVLFLVPLILLFSYLWGIDGIMYAAPVSDFIAFSLAVLLVRKEFSLMRKAETSLAL